MAQGTAASKFRIEKQKRRFVGVAETDNGDVLHRTKPQVNHMLAAKRLVQWRRMQRDARG